MRAITDDHFPALLVLLSPEAKTEKFNVGLGNVPYLRLLFVYHKKQLFFDEGFDALERSVGRLLTPAEDHHVVRISDETVTACFELLIELIEQDVGENGADRSALRRSNFSILYLAVNGYGCA